MIITRCTHLRKSKSRSLAWVFKISAVGPYFLLFDNQEAFHCCLVVACINRINMISIQCHRVGQWWAGKQEFENLLDSGQGKSWTKQDKSQESNGSCLLCMKYEYIYVCLQEPYNLCRFIIYNGKKVMEWRSWFTWGSWSRCCSIELMVTRVWQVHFTN